MDKNSLLIADPRTYAYWWTFIPTLPSSRQSIEYKILKRQWADHTMNCLLYKDGSWKLSSSRGFYVERREDHITTVLFHIWLLFPDFHWVGRILDLWGIQHDDILRARWSYSWEQKRDKSSRPDICDIVLCYEDRNGQGIVVIEAKRPGGSLGKKDLNGGTRYLDLPSLRPFKRRRCVFLVDERDIHSITASLPKDTPIVSWQVLGKLQAELASNLPIPEPVKMRVQTFIARHYEDLGISFDASSAASVEISEFIGTQDRYRQIREQQLPASIENFLLGSEASLCARSGRMPQPPFPWLTAEPSFVQMVEQSRDPQLRQTTQERERPLWRLP